MASNLSTIGFQFEDDAEFSSAMTRLVQAAEHRVACEAGEYAIWRCRSGASLWFHLGAEGDGTREVLGLTPFFDGKSEISIRVTDRHVRPGDNAFEGTLHVWIAPEEGEVTGGDGAYVALLDAVDFAALAGREPPFDATAQICAFARTLQAFADVDAYEASKGATENALVAPQAFIPTGLFPPGMGNGEGGGGPSTAALLTGRVLEHRLLTNLTTGRPFHWLLVESYAATFDVLADPEIVAGEIVEGGTIEAACVVFSRMEGSGPGA